MQVFDPNEDGFPPVMGGQGHTARQIRDSANAAWMGCGGVLVFAALAGIIAACRWFF